MTRTRVASSTLLLPEKWKRSILTTRLCVFVTRFLTGSWPLYKEPVLHMISDVDLHLSAVSDDYQVTRNQSVRREISLSSR